MIYTGNFTDRNNEQWKVELITDSTTSSCSIKLSDAPVVISYEAGDNIFKPLKLSGATIRCWVDDYMFDLFTAEPKGVSCNIYKGSILFWKGYVTPNIYNQSYNQKKFELEIECRDCLSVLEYHNYSTESKGIKSMMSILHKAFTDVGITGDILVHNFSDKRLDQLYINEQNFFDEDGKPMKQKEVIENLLTYLGLTAFQIDNRVYIVNYSLLNNDSSVFNKYVGGSYNSQITSSSNISLRNTFESTLSLTEVYDKVSIKSSLYAFNDITEDLFEKKNLMKRVLNDGADYTYKLSNKEVWTHKVKYLDLSTNHSNWRVYSYNRNATVTTDQCTPGNIYDNKFWNQIIKSGGWNSTQDSTIPADFKNNYYLMSKYIQGAKASNNIFDDKIVEYTSDQYLSLQGGYLIINAEVFFSNQDYPFYPEYASQHQPNFDGANIGFRNPTVEAWMKIGNKFWNGSSWTTVPSTFKITFGEGYKGTKRFNNWLGITDSNKYEYNIDKSGYFIKIPTDEVLTGNLRFFICQPEDYYMEWNSQIDYIFLREISIEYDFAIPDSYSMTEEIADTDTLYEGMINSDYIAEFEEIELKVCTANGKGNSKAAVLYSEAGKYKFLEGLKSNSLNKTQIQEQNLLEEYLKQFSKPNKQLNIKSKGFILPYNRVLEDGTSYMVNSVELNCIDNNSVLTLIEKR